MKKDKGSGVTLLQARSKRIPTKQWPGCIVVNYHCTLIVVLRVSNLFVVKTVYFGFCFQQKGLESLG